MADRSEELEACVGVHAKGVIQGEGRGRKQEGKLARSRVVVGEGEGRR